MKQLPKEARNQNVTGRQECRWCGDIGYVTVYTRIVKSAWVMSRTRPNGDGTLPHDGIQEEAGPCPYCEAGFREEFPVPKDGNRHPTKPPWGEDGFWQGRDVVDIDPVYPKGFSPLPLEENIVRIRELRAKMDKIGRRMPA